MAAMTPDASYYRLCHDEYMADINQEIYHGATEEAWRAVYQNPEGVTPGRLSEQSGLISEAPALSREVGQT